MRCLWCNKEDELEFQTKSLWNLLYSFKLGDRVSVPILDRRNGHLESGNMLIERCRLVGIGSHGCGPLREVGGLSMPTEMGYDGDIIVENGIFTKVENIRRWEDEI